MYREDYVHKNLLSTHCPHERVHGARLLTEEIPGGIMSCSRLWDLTIRLGLNGMDKVWELDGILNKENRNVVADNI